MRLAIRHHTEYHYAAPIQYLIQSLHLTPRVERHQRPLHWRIDAPGTLVEGPDAFGNVAHTLTLTEPTRRVALDVRGEIEIDPLIDGALEDQRGPPPLLYTVDTPLTAADEALENFAAHWLVRRTPHGALDFALAVRDAVVYRKGHTAVDTTAAVALATGAGVCQDHAHVFVGGCRALGVPARYVSGYFYAPDAEEMASHAWADVWLGDAGWISIDITHGCFATERMCRLAVGRDYESTAPVRGVRLGGGAEQMRVKVVIGSGAADDRLDRVALGR